MKKILLIDDDPVMADLLMRRLGKKGYEVEAAKDGEEGLLKVKTFAPNLIVLDILMPKIDGIEVLKKLKEDAEFSSIPVIMLTNSETAESIHQAKEAGSADYMIKVQHTSQEILEKIEELLSG